MRKIPYFAQMTDEQLRHIPLPPGIKDWGEIQGLNQQLDSLQWLFLPPETGPAATPQATPSLLWNPEVADLAPIPFPSAVFSIGPDEIASGQVIMVDQLFTITHHPGEREAEVSYQPIATDPVPVARHFRVEWNEDILMLLKAILVIWHEQMPADGQASPTATVK
ncbi:MAG: hypothetical protein VKN33_00530 [Candidatus Sericytochromatia bacterium]|nr:hypothetical protein [Candidatus Sericytochromatia bacterium]